MKKTLLAATVAVSMALGAGGGMMMAGAAAQPAPPPNPMSGPPPPHEAGGMPPWAMHHEHMGMMRRTFALFYAPEDRKLTPADVQKIAEAFLLWHGNRTWKVTDVAEAPDNTVAFTIATQDGSAVAKFTMDRKTGRVHRVG